LCFLEQRNEHVVSCGSLMSGGFAGRSEGRVKQTAGPAPLACCTDSSDSDGCMPDRDALLREDLGPDAASDSMLVKSCDCSVACKVCQVISPDEDFDQNRRKRPYAPEQLQSNRFLRKVFFKSRDQVKRANQKVVTMRSEQNTSTGIIASMEDEKVQTGKRFDDLTKMYERKCGEVREKDKDLACVRNTIQERSSTIERMEKDITLASSTIERMEKDITLASSTIERRDTHILGMHRDLLDARTTISALQEASLVSDGEQLLSSAQALYGPTVAQAPHILRVEYNLNISQQHVDEANAKIRDMEAVGVCKDDAITTLMRQNEELQASISKKSKIIEARDKTVLIEAEKLEIANRNVRSMTSACKTSREEVIELHNRIHNMPEWLANSKS
jgi:chromosome segregation ATPase